MTPTRTFRAKVVPHGCVADADKDEKAAVLFGDVVDEFLNEYSLAHAGAAEQAILPPLRTVGTRSTTLTPVSNISARVDCSSKPGPGDEWEGVPELDGAEFIDRLAATFMTRPRVPRPTGDGDRAPRSMAIHAADEAFGGLHGTQRTRPSPRCC